MVNLGAFSGAFAGGASVNIVIRGVDKFSKTIDRAGSKLGVFGKLAGTALKGLTIGAGLAATALAGIGIKAIKAGSDLEESINAVSVIFGEGAEQVLKFGETAATSVGLARSEFNQLSAVTGALLKDVGLPMEKVGKLTNELTIRAADMASVLNTDVKDALSAINQALRGETEAIRRYTGDVTDATLEQFRLAEGMAKPVKEMDQQEKRLLRLSLIMQQTEKFAGDFANTQDSVANKIRTLKATFTDIVAELGTSLQPAFKSLLLVFEEKILPVIKKLIPLLGPLLNKSIELITKGFQKLAGFFTKGKEGGLFGSMKKRFELFMEVIEKNKEPLMNIWNSFKSVLSTVFTVFKSLFDIATDIFGFLVDEGVIDLAVAAFEFLFAVLDKILKVLKGVFDFVVKIINKIANSKFGKIIWDAIGGLAKGGAGLLRDASDFIRGDEADDFISRPGLGVQKFSPSDTIIGVKDISKLGGRGVVVNIEKVQGTDPSDIATALQRKLSTMVSR